MIALAGVTLGLHVWKGPSRFALVVKTEQVKVAPVPLVVHAHGDLEPKRSLVLKAAFDGPIVQKEFSEGQNFSEGALLLEISGEKIQGDFEAKEIAFRNAKSDVDSARKELSLQRGLFKKQAVAWSVVEEQERVLSRAQQALKLAETALTVEQRRGSHERVLAPFDGVVLHDAIRESRDVATNQELLTFGDVSEYVVSALVDELDIQQVRVGQEADVTIPAVDDKVLKARVSRIGAQAEGTTSEVPVDLTLLNAASLPLLPKFTVSVRIHVGETPPVLSVPVSAIDNMDGRPRVWIVDRLGRLRPRTVVLGRGNPERFELVSGVDAGETVCSALDERFKEGFKVVADE